MSGRSDATATLEPAVAPASRVAAPPRAAKPTLRLGDLALPLARPAGVDEIAIEPGSFLGPVELRSIRWPGAGPAPPAPDERPDVELAPQLASVEAERANTIPETAPTGTAQPSPTLLGGISAPFVDASVAIDLDAVGLPAGPFRIDARIGLPGASVATLSYASTAAPLAGVASAPPLPRVEVDGDLLTIAVEGGAMPGVEVTGEGVIDLGDGRWTVPLPRTIVEALGTSPEPSKPEPVGLDRLELARASLAQQPSERQPIPDPARVVLEAILGVDLTTLGVHVDQPAERAAAAAGVPAFTLGSDAYFGSGAFGTDSREQAVLLARAVARALEGVSQVVVPGESVADPIQERSKVPSAAPAAPAAPTAALPPDEAGVIADAAALASEDAAAVATEQSVVPAAEVIAEAPPTEGELEAPAAVEGEAAEEEAAAPIELIMPPAPTEPGPAQKERIAGVSSGARKAAGRATNLPTAAESSDAARGAVTEPPAETAARAEAAVAEALGKRAEPSPEIVALCERIRTSIRERRPIDEDAAKKSDTEKVAKEAGQSLNSNIQSEAKEVEGSYAPLNNPPAGTPGLQPTPVQSPPSTVEAPAIGAEGGAPDAVPPENLSLDADRQATEAQIESSGINKPTAQAVQEPPFTTVREGQAELATLAENGPNQVATRQQEAIDRSKQDMAALQLQAVEALNASRAATVGKVSGGQTKMVGSEEQQRAAISAQAQQIFTEAQNGVAPILEKLQPNAMEQWDAGVDKLSTEFKDHLAMVKRWIDDRHSGVGGWFVSGWDAVTGLPDEITREYTKAEKAFGDGVCDLLLRISSDVNTAIALAEGIIESARERINTLFKDLPDGLREWAMQEQQKFNTQLDGLHEQATAARTGFVEGVSQKAVAAVAEVQAEIEQLREEAKGYIGKIKDAINAFIEDPVRAIINGLLSMVGIPPPRFWALVDKIAQVISDIADDPENFINNLVDALRQGFQQFFDNFGFHVLKGFWDWLFSGLGPVGVQLPKDMSVGSIITFALQVMGITWPNIRKILVKHIGEENVALIEQAWQLVSLLIEKGPSGILEMIKERLSPEALLETILKAAVDYLVENLIKAIAVKLISMLNPAGAIYQAIQLIYTILKWIFQNAAKIFSLVETVVGAMADVIAGNLTAVANAVEKALAMLIPPVIDFFASWLGFGDLPIKIAEIIKSLQEKVLEVIDQIVGWLVEQAKALLAAVGLGGDEDDDKEGADDTELGKVVPFRAAGESHSVSIDPSTAEVMVASVPTKVTEKLAEWEGKVKNLKGDKKDKATTLLAEANKLVAETNAEAAKVAPAIEAAKTDTSPEAKAAADDSAVESDEVTLAGTLRQLYEVFGEKPDLTKTFAAELQACHNASRADVEVGLRKLSKEKPELDLGEWSDIRSALAGVGGTINRAIEEPMHAGSGAYGDFAHKNFGLIALEQASSSDKAPVRSKTPEGREKYLVSQKRYIKEGPEAPYELAYAALRDAIFGGSDPTGVLEQAFRQKFEASTEPDEALQEAVKAAPGVVAFLKALTTGKVLDIDLAEFERLWAVKVNMDYIKGLFRDVPDVGSHEWIPTNMLLDVVKRAKTPKEGEGLYKWVDLQNELRTDTAWVIFDPGYAKGSVTPPGRPTLSTLSGHAGALYYRFAGEVRGHPLTTQQGPWHDRLRKAFSGMSNPGDVITAMQGITEETVWEGTTDETAGFYEPYFTKESEEDVGAVSISMLGGRQGGRYKELIDQFKEWKRKWS